MEKTAAAKTPPRLPAGLTPRLKTSELALLHSVSPWLLNKWAKQGCPVHRLPNGDRRWDPSQVDAWLLEQSEGVEEITADRSRKGVAARTA